MFFYDFLTNVLANVAFWLVGGVIIGIALGVKRRRMHRFFGITQHKPLIVYLSSLFIERNSIKGRDNLPSEYQGIVIVDYEFQVISRITTLFNSSFIDRTPDMFSGLIDSLWLTKRPIVEFSPCPINKSDLRFQNIICVGGPQFNTASEYYLRTAKPYFTFERANNTWRVKISRGSRTDEYIKIDSNHDIGLLQRIKDIEHNTIVFIAAGVDINGTRAAIEYLYHHWDRLIREYEDDEFGVCLRCPLFEVDQEGYAHYDVLLKLPDK